MIIPVRCFTCGELIANKYKYYKQRVAEKKISLGLDPNKPSIMDVSSSDIKKTPEGEVLDEIGLVHMCCRRMMLTHVDLINDI